LHKSPGKALFFKVAISLLLAVTLFTALLYPPNTWDSMTYHMPRVVHWINQQSIAFYPTDIFRQNYQMPLAEFAILHFQLLAGGDAFANMVQWTSYLCLICLSSVVAQELGLSPRQQLISALVTASLPMVLMQASSTQNDLVVSVFLCSFAFYMLRLRKKFDRENLLFAAISLGLALLTKGTAYIYAAAIGIALALPLLKANSASFRRLVLAAAALGVVAVVGLSFSVGHLHRNLSFYGHPLPIQGEGYVNQKRSIVVLGAYVLRNAALHLATPYPEIEAKQIKWLRTILGPNLEDPETTAYGLPFSLRSAIHEDSIGNLLHMLAVFVMLPFLAISWIKGRWRCLIPYSMAAFGGALIFCWTLKWQPWHSRLHTPLFVMAAPLIAITIDSIKPSKRAADGLCAVFFVFGLIFALNNVSRPLLTLDWMRYEREYLYFNNNPNIREDYKAAAAVLRARAAGQIGLLLGHDDWEYPLWALTGSLGKPRATSFQYVHPNDQSLTLLDPVFSPGYIVATLPIRDWPYRSSYRAIFSSEVISVLELQDSP
jgi:hypothetical protein